jgi:hypothetical protein
MSSRSSGPGRHSAAIALCGLLAGVAIAVFFAATAHASYYKLVMCAGGNGSLPYGTSTNTASPQNPVGIFSFENHCFPAPDPAGGSAFLRIAETQESGNAGAGAYGNMYFDTPAFVHFKAGGGWTRQAYFFNEGWRARFWVASACCTAQMMTQGIGLPNSGGQWATTGVFAPHLWPLDVYYDFNRFVYEMQCVRPAGCDRATLNLTDANSFVFILSDDSNSQAAFTDPGSTLMQGGWVRGTQNVDFNVSDLGSGLRVERMRVDGAQRWSWDHWPECSGNISTSQQNGEWARTYQPCPTGGPFPRQVPLDTASLGGDGAHSLQVCTQDYGQYQGLNGTGGESCDARTIRTDNTAPGAPSGLRVTSDNPHRYLDRFGAIFSLPPNAGSPIKKVHYDVVDAAGKVVVPEKDVSGTNPTDLAGIEGPKAPGAYQLRVWLEDEVGFVGPAATTPIPRDTTPPAAPQDLSVTSPTTPRSEQGFDVRWRNIVDAGAPIDSVHYQVLNGAGDVVVATKDLAGENPQIIANLDGPRERGAYSLRLWLSDAEGNGGAPVKAPLTYNCVRSDVSGGQTLSAGLGKKADKALVVEEGEGAAVAGKLQGIGKLSNAPLCVFSNVVTDQEQKFLGVAVTGDSGDYTFAIGDGPSRNITVVYRPGQRELATTTTLVTRVQPTFKIVKKIVRNKGVAVFKGAIPGPHNERVVVVLQVKDGKHWRVFRRYQTREGGKFVMRYRFTQTSTPTKYRMRAQVPDQSGYPYAGGNSAAKTQIVMP